MKITKLGHCCLLINIRGIRFLTDPGSYSVEQNIVDGVDYIVISHEHTDHLHIESVKGLLAKNPNAQIITNSSVATILQRESITSIKLSDGQTQDFSGVTLSAHGTKHELIYRDYEQVENTSYLFDRKFYYPGDAFHDPGLPVDILALPVTGPWCTIADALDYALKIKPRVAFPVHDGNLRRQNGITVRFPELFLPPAGISFIALEVGKETEL